VAEKVKVWFDPEADYLEVQFREAPGFMRPTAHDAVMERVDEQGRLIGSAPDEGLGHLRRTVSWM